MSSLAPPSVKVPRTKKGILQLEARFLAAAITSNVKEVTACLEQGVNVNAYIRGGSNALHIAAERGDIALGLTLALSPNLNYNAKTEIGYTSLMIACLMKKRRFVRFLMKHNADPNVQDRLGRTALHVICRIDAINLAMELFKYQNVDMNVVDCYGATPLLVALLEANSLHMSKLLLKHGAGLEVGPERCMPLLLECISICRAPEDIDKVLLLVKAGSDVNMVDPISGKTVLHFAALTGLLPLVIKLIGLGAPVNKTDISGRVASDVALMHGNYSTYKYLKKEELMVVRKEMEEKMRRRELAMQEMAGTSSGS